jgi:hypothetical protein
MGCLDEQNRDRTQHRCESRPAGIVSLCQTEAEDLPNVARAGFHDVNFFMKEPIFIKRITVGKKTGRNPNIYGGQWFGG